MNGDVTLKTFSRSEDRRVSVTWRTDGQRHWLELLKEERAGDGWRQLARICFAPGETFELFDALEVATKLAGTVRR